ncbi:Uncharacterized protein MCB1EB_0619 [Mycoavidus cysteinexigens]|uniref:Uncharacterized protein n=2 Tax=Mycoavidus cysteinexigens TaxID=1553431 RepID=A0A2Z6ETP9_9BURK|nr:Uncharacterized protein MCB1EB_0619 [Mycoavidus cysteinexigens]GAM52506.1 hypothetical protein EBME_0969 [bacterium endosymbiont of Mortierella elongata FMR23-6]GLR01602.1 hypothetical protein GCM10007934_14140 [Mycoavidus cysteinexigens]
MKFPGIKRRPPFVTLLRHKRSHEVICLMGKMRRDAADYGGRFTSRLVLNEPGRPDLYNQWFDFYFPGTDRFTIWNASFVTARKAFWDKAHDIAHTRVAEMLTPEEREENSKLECVPAQRSSTGKIFTYTLAEREEIRFEQFGGLTFHEQWRKLESEIARNEPPVIHESFKLDRSYVYGIGLKIVLDVDVVNQASIEAAIDRFFSVGETDWISPEPVACDRLPVVSEHEALATVKFPSE